MRVIEQARLWFREGASDKVYDIDLVEVATGQHVVNFRYGRRGGPLKDGTKTPLPLPLDRARSVYQKLVDEFPESPFRQDADQALKRLGAPATDQKPS